MEHVIKIDIIRLLPNSITLNLGNKKYRYRGVQNYIYIYIYMGEGERESEREKIYI